MKFAMNVLRQWLIAFDSQNFEIIGELSKNS